MGATVTTGKLAGAFKMTNGEIIYVLFEETYEKNCTPHTPHWSCYFIGKLADAIERIFWNASSCEGGSLQNRNGCITPEGYIAGWLKELAAPAEMPDHQLTLSVGDGFYSPIPSKAFPAVKKTLEGLGRTTLADDLSAGKKVDISLHHDADVILAIYGESDIAAWRFIESYLVPKHQDKNASLGYNPTPVKKFDVSPPAAMRVDDDVRLLQRVDGSWCCAGWQYSVVGEYISKLGASELSEPGAYRKRIKAFREALQSGPQIPEGTKVVVNMSRPMEDYQLRKAEELKGKASLITPTGFEVLVTNETSYPLTGLPAEVATWVFPTVP